MGNSGLMVRGIRVDGVGNSGLMVRGIQDLLCGEFRVDGLGSDVSLCWPSGTLYIVRAMLFVCVVWVSSQLTLSECTYQAQVI